MLKKRIIYIFLLLAISLDGLAAIRIVSYNTAQGARPGLSDIFSYIGTVNNSGVVRPVDIMLLQEQNSGTLVSICNELNSLYGSGIYSYLPLVGTTTGAGLPGVIFNSQTVESIDAPYVVNNTSGTGAARSTIRYHFRPVGYTSSGASFYVYNSHYKASTDSEDRRAVEASQIRADADALGDAHIIYAGDLNLYTSSEPAWQNLTAAGNGQSFDPVNRAGSWHNSSGYTDVHTQSPATSEQFPGQIVGGVDDRFDFQLITGEFKDNEGLSYVSGSYYTVGNNNTHNLNASITSGNDATHAIRNALESASDHLPVMADYQIPAMMQVSVDPLPQTVEIGNTYQLSVIVDNIAPAAVVADADELDYQISVSGDLVLIGGPGNGTIEPLAAGHLYTIELNTSLLGSKSGQLIVTSSSQGAENANYVLNLDYEVIDNNAIISRAFNWNTFYHNDPNAILGHEGDINYEVRAVEPTDSNALMLQSNELTTKRVYLAVMDQLVDADEIVIEATARTTAGISGLSIGCAYLSDAIPPYTLLNDLGPTSNNADPNWTSLQQTYTYDGQGGLDYPVILYAKIDPGTTSDVNDISITTKAHTTIQWPLATTVIDCPQNPEMDLNGDCIVNFGDLQYFGTWWMDGDEGAVSPESNPAVIITGIIDGTYSSGPRAIELYINGTVDLSEYTIERSLGGGAWADTTALDGTYSNAYVYLINTLSSGVAKFNAVFGTEGDFSNHALEDSIIACDGNDAFRLMKNAAVIDQVYWPTSVDGYEDSYLYRNDFTGPDGGWMQENWQVPGNNVLDAKTPEQIKQIVPFGTHVYMISNCTEQDWLDLNGDCQINLPDVVEFLDTWMQCNRMPEWACME